MIIEKVRIEEGFLGGQHFTFDEGLNVLIGARGTGKTSLIELIRWALNVQSFTESSTRVARDQALAVLKSGKITIEAREGLERIEISRSADDSEPRIIGHSVIRATILSQKEIEQIASDAHGRLRLLDEFVDDSDGDWSGRESYFITRIDALSRERETLTRDLDFLGEEIDTVETFRLELIQVRSEQADILNQINQHDDERRVLDDLDGLSRQLAQKAGIGADTRKVFLDWSREISKLQNRVPKLASWPTELGEPDQLEPFRTILQESDSKVNELAASANNAQQLIENFASEIAIEQRELSDRSRELRAVLESLISGAGAIAGQITDLEEKVARGQALIERGEALKAKIAEVEAEREDALNDLESLRDVKFAGRQLAAKKLNDALGPRIRIDVIRDGIKSEYISSLIGALRGHRIRYNSIAPVIAARISPRELMQFAETNDALSISDITQIDAERCQKVIEAVRDGGGSQILTCRIEDGVEFNLLDGKDYKSSSTLSLGQRCTVVLPILLEQRGRLLIADQPEDHLDNGFITETVVKAIQTRSAHSQVIIATHNANIPVLGNARRVSVMASNGDSGYLASTGSLDDFEIVESITRIMEGGRKAFEERAEFYKAHQKQ